jgi:hypothetical protein
MNCGYQHNLGWPQKSKLPILYLTNCLDTKVSSPQDRQDRMCRNLTKTIKYRALSKERILTIAKSPSKLLSLENLSYECTSVFVMYTSTGSALFWMNTSSQWWTEPLYQKHLSSSKVKTPFIFFDKVYLYKNVFLGMFWQSFTVFLTDIAK